MSKSLKLYITRVFDIKESELHKTLLLQLNIFLIITALLIVKPTINSIFLSELTSSALPLGYVLTAIVAMIGSFFYNKALEKYALNTIIQSTIIGSVISLIIFGVIFNFKTNHGILLYIPYVWVAIFGLLTASQFWILANLVYNVREAKRVFGFIGAGAIAGGIFGGYLTSVLTNIINTESLLFVAALLLIFCIPITKYIWKNEIEKLNNFQISIRSDFKEKSPLKLIKQSKLLSLIAIVIGISVFVAKLVDYQYSDYASRLIENQEDLTSFFGFWFSTLSVISLVIQLFATKRLVGVFGVGNSLLWLPSGILVGSFILLFIPQLWVIVLIKVIEGSLKQSVNKAATELLSIPIPIDIKKKTKTFTDVVVDSIATGLAGLTLIFFINGLKISSTNVSLIIITLIIIWLYFIYNLRKEYIVSFKKLFESTAVKKEKSAKEEIKVTSIVDTVIRVLTVGTEGQIIHMLQKTLEVKDERFSPSIESLLNNESPKIRALAIENLYFLRRKNLRSKIELMINDKDQHVTTSAFRYLLKSNDANIIELFNKYLNSSDNTISNAALVGLAQELRNNKTLQNKFSLEIRLQKALEQYRIFTNKTEKTNKLLAILEAIGDARMANFYSIISDYLVSKDNEILETAIISASKTLDAQFIDPIISHLSIRETRKVAIEALYNYGESIIDILFEKIKSEKNDSENTKYTILVIEKFASQKAINTLIKLTEDTEHALKVLAIEAVKRLKWRYGNLLIKDRLVIDKILDECQLYQNTLSAVYSQVIIQFKKKEEKHQNIEEQEARKGLISLLEHRLDRQLERIFKFLGITYPPNDIEPLLDIILNGKEEQRIHAIEFLDNILDIQLKKELIPIAESVLVDSFSEDKIKKLHLKIYSETECYKILLSRKDIKLKFAVLYLIEKSKDRKFIPLIKMATIDSNEKLNKMASQMLKNFN
ncbi:MFS transporter [Aureibaculum luteum]|uniref:MFS transporter n=1 Tax=Aureibaculum luteum TaxID=1548456 RepID=UPI000E4D7ABF|nr:MFS transporter [Aureibaculum luteum]